VRVDDANVLMHDEIARVEWPSVPLEPISNSRVAACRQSAAILEMGAKECGALSGRFYASEALPEPRWSVAFFPLVWALNGKPAGLRSSGRNESKQKPRGWFAASISSGGPLLAGCLRSEVCTGGEAAEGRA
jgi:hypothetical protein